VVVEIQDWYHVTVHSDVAAVVDAMLLGRPVDAQVRTRSDDGTISVRDLGTYRDASSPNGHGKFGASVPRNGPATAGSYSFVSRNGAAATTEPALSPTAEPTVLQSVRVLPFGVSRPKLEQAARELRLPVALATDIQDADLVLTLKPYYRRKPQVLRDAESAGKPIWVLKNNTGSQMQTALAGMFNLEVPSAQPDPSVDAQSAALQEAEDAINLVLEGGPAVDLNPQNPYIRRMQHRLAERYNLGSRSHGKEPFRRVRILTPGVQVP
jgi:hypothetical protein